MGHTTNFLGSIKVEVRDQFWIPDCPPDFAPMDHTWKWIKADMEKKTITLELVMLVETPHLIWANSHKCSPLELFVPLCLNSIWFRLSEVL